MSARVAEFYVVLEAKRYAGRIDRVVAKELRQSKPRIPRDAVAVRLRLTIEDSVFAEFIPTLVAEIDPLDVLGSDPIELTVVEPVPA